MYKDASHLHVLVNAIVVLLCHWEEWKPGREAIPSKQEEIETTQPKW